MIGKAALLFWVHCNGTCFGLLMQNRMALRPAAEPSNYMQELTRYLSNIMNSVLLGLPMEIKELIYFDALSHAVPMILVSCELWYQVWYRPSY